MSSASFNSSSNSNASITANSSTPSTLHSCADLYSLAYRLAEQAVRNDQEQRYEEARAQYLQVVQIFQNILGVEPDPLRKQLVIQKSQEYTTRADQLTHAIANTFDTTISALAAAKLTPVARSPSPTPLSHLPTKSLNHEKPPLDHMLEKARFALDQAVLRDDRRDIEDALTLYSEAADWFLQAYKACPDENSKLRADLKARFTQTIDRAEELKDLQKPRDLLVVQNSNIGRPKSPSMGIGKQVEETALHRGLTRQEIEILKKTSVINGKTYLPWIDIDLKERFSFDEPFVDPDGLLALSVKQKSNFGAWRRPSQIMSKPTMIQSISSTSIIQDVVTDCSFVASLCVSAAYERKHKKQLITACIYPQDKNGRPCYNPSGKYMIKLTYNGIGRKVVVDDLLPVSRNGGLMCTFSNNGLELWPSIIEKAYMKMMGGYDFPGSNSGIDLHALTGWIPEHIFIHYKGFVAENIWNRIHDGCKYGDALVTIATGEMTDADADACGLVPTHAYAVLDIQQVLGHRLLQVKNPWSHKRWTGPYSHLDTQRWTPELMRALDYNPQTAAHRDDGIFWIDFESVCTAFDAIHMNWNPELFPHRWVLHSPWPCDIGPKKDIYNLGHNPQYSLEVSVSDSKPAAVWLLLSKHITIKEENKDYINLYVYDKTNGERVYYPGKPLKEGVYVNSPHVLVRFNSPPGTHRYTIVISQHEKSRSLNVTLRAYCISPFKLVEVTSKYPYDKKITGQWTEQTAGGNTSNAGYMCNPQWKLTIPPLPAQAVLAGQRIGLLLMLEAPRTFPIHVKLVQGGKRVTSVSVKDVVAQSGDYRHGFCYCEVADIKPGEYTIVVSTYEAGLLGDFFLTVSCNVKVTTAEIPQEGAGMFKKVIKGQWVLGVSAMGCPSYRNYHRNPRYHLDVKELTTVKVRLQTPDIKTIPTTNVTIFECTAATIFGKEIATSGPYTNVVQGVATNYVTLTPNPNGYIVVFSTWEPGIAGNFLAYLYSDRPVVVAQMND